MAKTIHKKVSSKKVKDEISTEDKIKKAARIVFIKKGYAATKTRDIAEEEADINLALLNYYFRSKEKLFELIMLESAEGFLRTIKSVLHNEDTDLNEKIDRLVESYIEMLIKEPNFPFFMLSEIQANPEKLLATMDAKNLIIKSVFFKQLQEALKKKGNNTPPIHFLINIISLTVFPFVAKPILMNLSGSTNAQFNEMMMQRKTLIPKWIKLMIKTA